MDQTGRQVIKLSRNDGNSIHLRVSRAITTFALLCVAGTALTACANSGATEAPPAKAEAAKPSSPTASGTLSCADAFREAASVPLSRTNDAEVRDTVFACADVNEWWSNAKAFPDAFGATSYADSELGLYVGVACYGAESSPVCADAASRGLN